MSRRRVELAATATEPALALPAIGQGTWHMAEGRAPRDAEIGALRHGLDRGLSVIDTAEMYASGDAERLVGEAIAGRRDQAFLVSKVFPWNAGRDEAVAACEASLARLGTDHLDLYLLHWPGRVPLEETVEAFERLIREGKIRRWGVSNFDVEDLEGLAAIPGGAGCAINQVLYHPGSRGIEHSLLPWQRQRAMPTMAYCPLAGGRGPLASQAVREVADEFGIEPASVILAWLTRPRIGEAGDVMAIPKAGRVAHVDANAAALELELTDRVCQRMEAAFPPPVRRPPLDIV